MLCHFHTISCSYHYIFFFVWETIWSNSDFHRIAALPRCLSASPDGCWIGLYQIKANGPWHWKENNLSVGFTYWANLEPSNDNQEDYCTEIRINAYSRKNAQNNCRQYGFKLSRLHIGHTRLIHRYLM